MKETIHTKNSFRSADVEHLRKAVTEKIEKLVNRQVKRKNYLNKKVRSMSKVAIK